MARERTRKRRGKRQRRIIRCGALKSWCKKGGKAKLPWWFLSEGRISVGVDVVGRVTIEHSPRKERGPRRKYARGRNRPWERKQDPILRKMVRVHVLIGYLVAGGVSDGVFLGHVCLFSRYGRFFVRFLSRFSSRHPSVLVLRANRGDGEPRAHASKVERCDSLKDRSDGLFARSLRCVV